MRVAGVVMVGCALAGAACAQVRAVAGTQWTATWAASPAGPPGEGDRSPVMILHDETLREVVHTSIGGTQVRVRISNAFGVEPLRLGAAHVALRSEGSKLMAGSDRTLLFGGAAGITVPAGASVLSDAVALNVPALSDVAVSLYVPQTMQASTLHYGAQQTSYAAAGNQAAQIDLAAPKSMRSWPFLTALEVSGAKRQRAIVALGSSTTDGARSTMDTNHRWTDILAARLQHDAQLNNLGVLNEGIGGNRVLHDGRGPSAAAFGVSASARFDRDVLAQSNVGYLIFFEGGNDINHPGASAPLSETITADDLIAGYRQMIVRAHGHGIRVIGATITPFEGVNKPEDTASREAMRAAVNQWIMTTHETDGVIDFSRALADPAHPTRIDARFDSGDHLHPNDAGYKAMGDAIDLKLFRTH